MSKSGNSELSKKGQNCWTLMYVHCTYIDMCNALLGKTRTADTDEKPSFAQDTTVYCTHSENFAKTHG